SSRLALFDRHESRMRVATYRLGVALLAAVGLFALICCRVSAEKPQSPTTANNTSKPTTTATTTPSPWGQVSAGLQSRIWTDASNFTPADPIPVHYEIRNASDQPQQVWHNGFWPSNRIDVTDPAGHPAELTAAG